MHTTTQLYRNLRLQFCNLFLCCKCRALPSSPEKRKNKHGSTPTPNPHVFCYKNVFIIKLIKKRFKQYFGHKIRCKVIV